MKIEAHSMAKYNRGTCLISRRLVPSAVGGMIRIHIKNPTEISGQATQPDAMANLSDVGPFEIS
jgi:hypothetical protein